MDGTRIFRMVPSYFRHILIDNSIKSSSLRRVSVPSDITKLIIFLASSLSSCLNGQQIHVIAFFRNKDDSLNVTIQNNTMAPRGCQKVAFSGVLNM